MKIRPLHDNVVIEPESVEQTTKAGIVLPETGEQERSESGKVLAVGPGKLLENGQPYPPSVKIGDKIIFKKYASEKIKIEEQEYLLISEENILAVLE